MKKYIAILMPVILLACSKKDAATSNTVKPPVNPTLTNCFGKSIAAGNYFFMSNIWGTGAGSQCIWYTSTDSWGADCLHVGSGIKAYPAMVWGCHWGGCSAANVLPKKISSLGICHSWWTQSSTGTAWDAAYDIWFDDVANPGNKAAKYELMVWLNWTGTKPIAGTYDAGGNAIPYASNVTTTDSDGTKHTWNIYRRNDVFSFLLTSKSDAIVYDIKPLIDYCTKEGWMSASAYMISIQAGWEVISGGTYKTTSYGISGV